MTDALKPMRPFTAHVRYPGKKPFMVGTFLAEKSATDHDRDLMVLDEVRLFWADHMPDGVEPPAVEKTDWGSFVFVEA